jgi:hypothetical protein
MFKLTKIGLSNSEKLLFGKFAGKSGRFSETFYPCFVSSSDFFLPLLQ